MHIAIVGRGSSSRLTPTQAPGWQVWAMPWCPPGRVDRYFDIHARRHRQRYGGHGYEGYLAGLPNLTMLHDPLPHAALYPLAAVRAQVGPGVLTSSVAYMLAAAILDRPAVIGLYGVEMVTTDEYRRQRPAIHYLLGLAHGVGIGVHLPPGCRLFQPAPDYGA
ncbi:hypothetical protein [Niveispirillum fermenti]|uniref:hypothetical protein n=1 Tax=Niveispirillum fermenti TaxID=1233113 RepID=UPI003A881251